MPASFASTRRAVPSVCWITDSASRSSGAMCRGAYFQTFRRQEQVAISDEERQALTRLLDDPDLFGLAGVLEPDRAERLTWRARRMLELGVVLFRGVV